MRLTRRSLLAGIGAMKWPRSASAQNLQATVHGAMEWSFTSTRSYDNPFADVELDVVVRGPDGAELRVPAFWAGDQTWRVRYSPANTGVHAWRTICSDPANSGLHAQRGTLEAVRIRARTCCIAMGPFV